MEDNTDNRIERDVVTSSTVCDNCGSKWNSEIDWLRNDPCIPDNKT